MEKIYSAKTVEEAVEKASAELGVKKEDVSYEIEELGAKGFFGIGFKPARIKVVFEVSVKDEINEYLEGLLAAAGVEGATIETEVDGEHISIQITGENADMFLVKQGESVEGLQLLTAMTVNKSEDRHYKVSLNVNDYREKSKIRLEALAVKTAKQVLRTHRRVTLNPMSAYQRRIIHSKLQDMENITTYSVGSEPNRKVVISYQFEDGSKGGYKKPYSGEKKPYSGNKGGYKKPYQKRYNNSNYNGNAENAEKAPEAAETATVEKTEE